MQKILVIDDDDDLRESISDILELNNYESVEADNGAAGVTKALRINPDLIVCDVMMPQMNGFEVLELLRENPDFEYTPFIFLTARAESQTIREGMNLGANDFLNKPFEMDDLLNTIRSQLKRYGNLKRKLEKDRNTRLLAIFEGQEYERKRIAREIHDGIGQMLVAAKFGVASLEGLSKNSMNKKVSEIEQMLGNIIEETRRVSENLTPKSLEKFGLIAALQELYSKANKHHPSLNIIFETNLTNELFESASENLAIYRIIQETLNNVIKHAEAKRVTARVERKNGVLFIKVKDDGKGFLPEKASGTGNGLNNLKERTRLLNGKLEINSQIEKGTEVHITLPLKA